MLSFIRAIPFVGIALLFAYGAHQYVVGKLETQISNQQQQIDVLNQRNVVLESAAQINEQTIKSLEDQNKRQIQQISSLAESNTEYQRQADEAMAIFRNHNLTILARRRPNMIESRANDATADVFRSVEADSRDTEKLNNDEDNK